MSTDLTVMPDLLADRAERVRLAAEAEVREVAVRAALDLAERALWRATGGPARETRRELGPKLADLINACPDSLRRYIHDLECQPDPAGHIRDAFAWKENAEGLAAALVYGDDLAHVVAAELTAYDASGVVDRARLLAALDGYRKARGA